MALGDLTTDVPQRGSSLNYVLKGYEKVSKICVCIVDKRMDYKHRYL